MPFQAGFGMQLIVFLYTIQSTTKNPWFYHAYLCLSKPGQNPGPRCMTQKEEYLKIYNALNERQKLAVDTLDGPVMVIAGPGTGKTQILSAQDWEDPDGY